MKKKTITGVALLMAALFFWAGFRSWGSPSPFMTGYAVAAFLMGGALCVVAVAWIRARPGSGDALFLPGLVLLSAAQLIGLLPRMLWPSAENFQIGASVGSVLLTTIAVIMGLRQSRRLRARRN